MNAKKRQMHLNAFLMGAGQHEAAWRMPNSNPDPEFDVAYWVSLAQIAEEAKFDSLFVADSPVTSSYGSYDSPGRIEPLVLMSALAMMTRRIGLIATVSTEYSAPYNLARQLASIDHVSGGRAGWNIVTTWDSAAAANFGMTGQLSHTARYERAAEFVELECQLWDSWELEAAVGDKAAGLYVDTDRLHPVNHHGRHYDVAGALNVRRPPQGRPLLVQAGSSETGKRFAARYAEAIFTAQQTIEGAAAFYADIKSYAREAGRNPEHVKLLPGIMPIIGSTEAEAHALADELNSLRMPEMGLRQLGTFLGIDASSLELDAPLPAEAQAGLKQEGWKSRAAIIREIAESAPTVRQILSKLAGGRGHFIVVGTPEKVADTMTRWFENNAADGFNVMPPVLPDGLTAFVDHVLPLLRSTGLFREEYSGSTLRSHYGIPVPENSFHQVGVPA